MLVSYVCTGYLSIPQQIPQQILAMICVHKVCIIGYCCCSMFASFLSLNPKVGLYMS